MANISSIQEVLKKTSTQETALTSGADTGSSDFSSYLDAEMTSLEAIFQKAAQTYGVDVNLLKAIAKQESDFDVNSTSGSGAMGLMQLMPGTAAELGVTDAYDAEQNVMGGAKYIRMMLDRYDGNITLALAAYNAGSGNVAKYGGVPPFAETQNYVVKVMSYYENGVTLPDTAVQTSGAASTLAAAELSANEEALAEAVSVADDIFNYDDYLEFLTVYLDLSAEERAQQAKEVQQEMQEAQNAYRNIKYNQSILNLFTGKGM